MKVALFVPCYIDAFFPEVGVATLELLERLDIEVVYPLDQLIGALPEAEFPALLFCHIELRRQTPSVNGRLSWS